MAYVFLDDGGPEASELESNYVYFDERQPESIRKAQRQLRASGFSRAADSLGEFWLDRSVHERVERESSWILDLRSTYELVFHALFGSIVQKAG